LNEGEDNAHLPKLRTVQNRNGALVYGEDVNLVHGDGVDRIQRAIDDVRFSQNSVDGEVVAVVILRRQAEHCDAATLKRRGAVVTPKQSGDGKALPLDPERLRLRAKNAGGEEEVRGGACQ
jgi:hypothetical protein